MDFAFQLEKFQRFTRSHALFDSGDRILLAVSGGKDSMTMLNVFSAAGLNFGIAHCNFQLRGEESDGDENFLRHTAEESGIPLFVKRFDCRAYAKEKDISIQMAARELRYDWFDKLLQIHNYSVIATAHHLDDSVESTIMHLLRGSGVKGLKGIPVKRDSVIRPMMCFSRSEIDQMVVDLGVKFREDRSNATNAYLRNKIRHELIPHLKALDPEYVRQFATSQDILRQESEALDYLLEQHYGGKDNQEVIGDHTYSLSAIKADPGLKLFLTRKLVQSGFSYDQITDIIEGDPDRTGVEFKTDTKRVVLNRGEMILTGSLSTEHLDIEIAKQPEEVSLPGGKLHFNICTTEDYRKSQNPNVEYVDIGKVSFPLCVKTWKQGDRFQPIGMGGSQKLQDYFTNQKLSALEKEEVLILWSGEKILWVIPYRISEEFKVDSDTRECLRMEWRPHKL